MRIRYQRLRQWGLRAIAAVAIVTALYGLYAAAFKGVVLAPLGPLSTLISVTFHEHPFWFAAGIAADLVGLLMFVLLLSLDWREERRIRQKFPMRNY